MKASESPFLLYTDTEISFFGAENLPIQNAIKIFKRDLQTVCRKAKTPSQTQSRIELSLANSSSPIAGQPERFQILCTSDVLRVIGSDELGIIYGLFYLSRQYLGIDPFWFWADSLPKAQEHIEIPCQEYLSSPFAIRYRGWFVNDETCFIGWKNAYPPTTDVWAPVFECLLRLGGNMVIPGTDLPRDGVYWDLAAKMGLMFTHHHVEPLGAEMFSRRFPEKNPSYAEFPHLFEQLWTEAITRQKDRKGIWVLGFRGQGDIPFWENDPHYATPDKRGEVISTVITHQYSLVQKMISSPTCATYIYGELAELYRGGHLKIPAGVIKVWADNGYGKMVSRRMGLDNPRVPALPTPEDAGPHGVYYHVSFHDLQASNHLTMMIAPQLITSELSQAITHYADKYWIINSGVIRPHLLTLDLIGQLWQTGSCDPTVHLQSFVARFFHSHHTEIVRLYQNFFACPIHTGPNTDERAGEQFYHYPIRQLCSYWIRGKTHDSCKEIQWATGVLPFESQIKWLLAKYQQGLTQWTDLDSEFTHALTNMNMDPHDSQFLFDNLGLSIQLHLTGAQGAVDFCHAFVAYSAKQFLKSFIYLSRSIATYQSGVQAMTKTEHDKWLHFFDSDWTTNVRTTIYALDSLRKYIRALGDDSRFTQWSNKYVLKIVGDQKIKSKFLSDEELGRELLKINDWEHIF